MFWVSCFFTGCTEMHYEYLDVNSLYTFKVGDTLIYKSKSTPICDTFKVREVYKYMLNSDKWNNYESLQIGVSQLNKDCSTYCYGFSILRQGTNLTSIEFRKFSGRISSLTPMNTYKIGQTTINNVYVFEFYTTGLENNKDIKTVYYIHKYGIIAYKIISGEIMELDEKYIKN